MDTFLSFIKRVESKLNMQNLKRISLFMNPTNLSLVLSVIWLASCNPLSQGTSGFVGANYQPGYTPSVPLEVRITDMPPVLRGGQAIHINFTLPSGMASGFLEYSENGTLFSQLSVLTPVDYTHAWVVPVNETLMGKLRIRVIDSFGRQNSVQSSSFIVDSTSPASPGLLLATSNPTNALTTGFTAPSCADRAKIYISETSTAPLYDSLGWQNCTTSAGALVATVSAGDGAKLFYEFAQDSVGNVSVSSTSSLTLDQTAPVLSLSALSALSKGGASTTLSWAASDALSGLSSFNLYYALDGTTFTSVAAFISSDTSTAWTTPSDNTTTAKIKLTATDVAGNITTVMSSAFTVDSAGPVLSLTSPSTVLKGGMTLSIPLSSSDALSGVSTLKIQYAVDGTTFSDLSTLATSATTYSWTVPTANTTIAKLKLVSTDGVGNSSSLVSSSFTIDSTAPTLTLSSLSGGQVIGGGVATTINWSASDLNPSATPVKIELSSDGGSTYATLAAAVANSGTYNWTTPIVTSTTYRVRITFTDAAGNATSVSSTSNFSINSSSPVANVTSPNGGEVWKGASSHAITWSASGLPAGGSTAKLEYSVNAGSTYTTIVSALTNAAGSNTYAWTLPAATDTSQGRIRVTITDSFSVDVLDTSDSNFAIDSTNPTVSLTSLTGGTTVPGGASSNITWTATDTNPGTNTVNLDVSSDGGSTWSSIAAALSNSGSYSWSVPSVTSTTYRVRVSYSDAAGNSGSSASSSNFRINSSAPVIAVTAPNGGENLKGAGSSSIMWSTSGLPTGTATVDLDYTTNGTVWTSVATAQANTGTYAWTIPAIDSSSVKVRASVTDSFGVVTSDASNANFIIDSTAPALTMTDPTGPYRGGAIITVPFTAVDTGSGLLTLKFQYAANGTTFSDVATLATSDTSYSWTVPSANVATAKVRIYAVDASGNTATQTSAAFTIDSTAPTAPAVTLASANPTNSTAATLTITSCTDRTSVYVSESATAPAYNAAGWQTCSTTTGAITKTLSAGDATKTLYIFAQDTVGNVSLSISKTVVLDQTAPGAPPVTFSANGTALSGGNTTSITMTVSSCTDRSMVLVSESGTAPALVDSGWQTCVTTAAGISHSLLNTSLGAHSLYAWARDIAGNTSASGALLNYSYDTSSPIITAFTLAGGATNVANPTVAISITASDTYSGISEMCLSETATCTTWLPFAATGANFRLTQTNGAKIVTLWVKDGAGNLSTTSPTYNLTLDFGTPPMVTVTSPVVGSSYAAGQIVPIAWTCAPSSAGGLAAQPISKIEYTIDDGATFVVPVIESNLTNNDTSTSGHYDWRLPVGVGAFRLLVSCKSVAGVISTAYSPVLGTTWSIFMGDPWYGLQNVNAIIANASWNGTNSSITSDAKNNIYYVKNNAVMKIDAISGQVTTFMGDLNTSGCGTGAPGANRFLSSPQILGTDATHETVLVLSKTCNVIYGITTSDSTVTNWATVPANLGTLFLTKNRILIFGASTYLYKLDLSMSGNSAVSIYGNGTNSVDTGRYTIGTVVTGAQIARPTQSALIFNDFHLTANDDASSIRIDSRNLGNGYRIDLSGSNYIVGNANLGTDASQRQNCVRSDSDSNSYCTSRDLSPGGRGIYAEDATTFASTGGSTLPFDQNDNSGSLRLGTGADQLVASYSLNGIFTIIPNPSVAWNYTRIAGQYLATRGNGINASVVGFDTPVDIKYAGSKLFVRNISGHFRQVDFTTNPYSISTLFGSTFIVGGSANYVAAIPNLAGDRFVLNTGCSRRWIFNYALNGELLDAGSQFLGGPCDLTTGKPYPPITGSAANGTTLSTIFSNAGMGIVNPVYHSSGDLYFPATNGSADNFIFKSDTTTLTRIAGKVGAGAYVPTDSGGAALGGSLTRVQQMQEIATGAYAGDLLIWDKDWLRRISVVSDTTPKIYDVVKFTMAAGYTSGTSFQDAYYDQSTERSGVFGSGNMYYVNSSNIVHKFVPNAPLTSATDTAYSFTGTTLGGIVRIALTPAGLLVLQPNMARILRVAP